MTKAQAEYAERKAMEIFDEWNEITGHFQLATGSYSEIQAIIYDAVHIGIHMAMFGHVKRDAEGYVQKSHMEQP